MYSDTPSGEVAPTSNVLAPIKLVEVSIVPEDDTTATTCGVTETNPAPTSACQHGMTNDPPLPDVVPTPSNTEPVPTVHCSWLPDEVVGKAMLWTTAPPSRGNSSKNASRAMNAVVDVVSDVEPPPIRTATRFPGVKGIPAATLCPHVELGVGVGTLDFVEVVVSDGVNVDVGVTVPVGVEVTDGGMYVVSFRTRSFALSYKNTLPVESKDKADG